MVGDGVARREQVRATHSPEDRHGRVFRAYNSGYDMIDAKPVNGDESEAVIEKLLGNPETAFVDARSADRGCYTFRIERI